MKEIETTLLLLKKENEILLAMKKRGFGVGKYNGVGGKLKKEETPEIAMIREAKEEINITPLIYEKMGEVNFLEYENGKKVKLKFHLFLATAWEGIPSETEEMKPYWFNIADIPYEKMFVDDKYWLPFVLKGKKINGFVQFDENWNLEKCDIQEINNDDLILEKNLEQQK